MISAPPPSYATDTRPVPCDRCGTFTAPDPRGVRQLCDACRERRAIRFDETSATTGQMLREVFVLLRVLHFRALVPVFLLSVPFALVHALWEIPAWAQYGRELVEVIADVALIHMTCALVDGKEPRLGPALALALRRWPLVLLTMILSLVAIGLGFVALVVPGIILSLGLALAPALAGLEAETPVAALRRSWRMMTGYKSSLFAAHFLLGIASTVAGAILGVVEEAFWAAPIWYDLSESASFVLACAVSMVFTTFVYSLPDVPRRLVLPVLYVKLRRAEYLRARRTDLAAARTTLTLVCPGWYG